MKPWLILNVFILTSMSTLAHAGTFKKGVYSGSFGHKGKATLFIETIKNGTVKGHSLFRHNYRPLEGTMVGSENRWLLVLNEPGTQAGDGQFIIKVNGLNGTMLKGKWKPFSNKKNIKMKSFIFKKASCGLKPGVKSKINQELSDDDLYLRSDALAYMRNEAYAQHGYSFKSERWSKIFANKDWYVPCYTSVNKMKKSFSALEKKNLRRIKKMEVYAIKNPEQFGR